MFHMYTTLKEEIRELRETVGSQKQEIEALRTEIQLVKSGSGTDANGAPVNSPTGATWSDLVKGKSSASTAAVVAIMAKEKREVEDR
jgi:hypothetical protein